MEKISISNIIKHWPVLFICILLFSLLFNVYGVKEAKASVQAALELHEEFAEKASSLPAYFTEDLYALRRNITANEAEYAEAIASVYRNFAFKYGIENDLLGPDAIDNMEDNSDFLSYSLIISKIKDIRSLMGQGQYSYFLALIDLPFDGDYESIGAKVEDFESPEVFVIQPKWIVIGAVFGIIVDIAIVYLIETKKVKK